MNSGSTKTLRVLSLRRHSQFSWCAEFNALWLSQLIQDIQKNMSWKKIFPHLTGEYIFSYPPHSLPGTEDGSMGGGIVGRPSTVSPWQQLGMAFEGPFMKVILCAAFRK